MDVERNCNPEPTEESVQMVIIVGSGEYLTVVGNLLPHDEDEMSARMCEDPGSSELYQMEITIHRAH